MSDALPPWDRVHDQWAELLDNSRDCRTLLERIEDVIKPFTATTAVAGRLQKLGISADDLADKAGVPRGAVRYFGLCPHSQADLERLSLALDWPPDHLQELLGSPE